MFTRVLQGRGREEELGSGGDPGGARGQAGLGWVGKGKDEVWALPPQRSWKRVSFYRGSKPIHFHTAFLGNFFPDTPEIYLLGSVTSELAARPPSAPFHRALKSL